MLRKGRAAVTTKPAVEKKINDRVFIGTLGVNCLRYTRRMLDSVQSSAEAVRVVYIDNGSTDENVEQLKTWKKCNSDIDEFAMGFNGYNAGVAVGWNQLIKMALEWGATKIIICNNDIVFGPHTVDGLCEAWDRLRDEVPETVMVTATNHTKNPDDLKNVRQVWKYHEHPDFSCFMVTPETIERIGFISEEYEPAFFEDNDTHWRIIMMGYKAFGTDWAPYSHVASRTRHENPNLVPHEQFRANKIKFYRRNRTNDVDQSIAEERYAHWLNSGGHKHPEVDRVLDLAEADGLITPQLKQWLAERNIQNTP